jgi:hypothetical protein
MPRKKHETLVTTSLARGKSLSINDTPEDEDKFGPFYGISPLHCEKEKLRQRFIPDGIEIKDDAFDLIIALSVPGQRCFQLLKYYLDTDTNLILHASSINKNYKAMAELYDKKIFKVVSKIEYLKHFPNSQFVKFMLLLNPYYWRPRKKYKITCKLWDELKVISRKKSSKVSP